MMLGTVRPSAFTGPLHLGKVGSGACVTNAPSEYDGAELCER